MSKYVYGDRTVMEELQRVFDVGRLQVGGTGLRFSQLWRPLTTGGLRVADTLVEAGMFMLDTDGRTPLITSNCTEHDAVNALSTVVSIDVAPFTAYVRRRLVTDDVKSFTRNAMRAGVQTLYVARNCVDRDDFARDAVSHGADDVANAVCTKLMGLTPEPIAAFGRIDDFAWALKCPIDGVSRLCGKMHAMRGDRTICVAYSQETAELAGDHVSAIDLRAVQSYGELAKVRRGDVAKLVEFFMTMNDFNGYDVKEKSRGTEIYAPRLRDQITGRLTNVREDVSDVWTLVSQLAMLSDSTVEIRNIKDVTASKSTIIDIRTELNGVTVYRENFISLVEPRSNLRLVFCVED